MNLFEEIIAVCNGYAPMTERVRYVLGKYAKEHEAMRTEIEQRGLYIEELKRDLLMVDEKNGALGAEIERLRERVAEHQRKFEAGWHVLRKQRDEARAEVERLTAEVEMLRGVGCCESDKLDEPPSGPCDVCRKCASRRGAEAMREACAVLVSNEKRLWLRSELIADLRALPIPEEP